MNLKSEKHKLVLLKYIVGLLFLFIMIVFTSCNTKHSTDNIEIRKIIDGDTYHILINGKDEKVRLIGIDTPESKHNKKAQKDAKRSDSDIENIVVMGKEATEFVRTIIKPGDHLRIEFDIRKRDQYGRLLAYLYLPDGRMLNELIVHEGYATVLTYPPDVKYVNRFTAAFQEARTLKKGLWRE
jgi:micrococcal nuclease